MDGELRQPVLVSDSTVSMLRIQLMVKESVVNLSSWVQRQFGMLAFLPDDLVVFTFNSTTFTLRSFAALLFFSTDLARELPVKSQYFLSMTKYSRRPKNKK